MHPIRNAKVGNPLEIPQVGGEQQGIMNQGDGRDLEIHRPDANTLVAQILERLGRLVIEQHQLPPRKEVKKAQQLLVGRHLSRRIVGSVDQC